MLHLLKICSKIVAQPCQRLCDSAYHNKLVRLSNNIIDSDPNHVLNSDYELLPSNRRYRVPRFNKVRLKHSFVHQSILIVNTELNPRSNARWRLFDQLFSHWLCCYVTFLLFMFHVFVSGYLSVDVGHGAAVTQVKFQTWSDK